VAGIGLPIVRLFCPRRRECLLARSRCNLVSDVSASTTGTIIRSMVDGPRFETLIFQRGLRGFEERLTQIEQGVIVNTGHLLLSA
jgi:hypothetical protein